MKILLTQNILQEDDCLREGFQIKSIIFMEFSTKGLGGEGGYSPSMKIINCSPPKIGKNVSVQNDLKHVIK